MAVRGAQDLWVVGCRVYFRRDGQNDDKYLDLGTITQIQPNFNIEKITLEDPYGGVKSTIYEVITKFDETYDLTCSNFAPDLLALIFNSSAPAAHTQAATVLTAVPHTVKKGHLCKLRTAGGANVYNITSVGAVTDSGGTTTYVLDTDYSVVDLKAGLIKILPGGAIADGIIKITFTPAAVTDALAQRLIVPGSAGGSITGDAIVVFSRGGRADESYRECKVSISPGGPNLSADQVSDHKLTLTVLRDPTAAQPGGQLLQMVGTLPPQA
jgi:hypothetical protein